MLNNGELWWLYLLNKFDNLNMKGELEKELSGLNSIPKIKL
jgi:hypothetical protein